MQQLRRKDEKIYGYFELNSKLFQLPLSELFCFIREVRAKQIIKVYESWEFFCEFMKAKEEYNFGMHDIQ